MTDKVPFKVTEKAGEFVAGQRSPGVGETMMLSEEQAEYALILGEIERPARPTDQKAKPAKSEPAA